MRRYRHRDVNERANTLFAAALAASTILIGVLLVVGRQGPSNRVMAELAPLPAWGVVFLAAGLLGLVGQILPSVAVIRVAHGAATVLAVLVAGCLWVAATTRHLDVSLHWFGWALNAAVLHFLVAWVSRPRR